MSLPREMERGTKFESPLRGEKFSAPCVKSAAAVPLQESPQRSKSQAPGFFPKAPQRDFEILPSNGTNLGAWPRCRSWVRYKSLFPLCGLLWGKLGETAHALQCPVIRGFAALQGVGSSGFALASLPFRESGTGRLLRFLCALLALPRHLCSACQCFTAFFFSM